jgi:hypothetical protein
MRTLFPLLLQQQLPLPAFVRSISASSPWATVTRLARLVLLSPGVARAWRLHVAHDPGGP